MKFPDGFNLIIKPIRFQAEGIIYGIIHPNPGLLFGVGLGKTMAAINIARYRIQFSGVNKVLILAPPSIMYNWKKEINKFSEYDSIILHGDRKERIYRLKYFKNDPRLQFGIINYEALSPFMRELQKIRPNMIIADESARYIKNQDASRTSAAIWLGDQAQYRSILTATPIAHRPIDIWSQFRFLDKGKLFTDNFYRFRYKYFKEKKFPRYKQYILKPNSALEISDKIYTTCIRFTKKQKSVIKDLQEFYSTNILTDHAYQIIKIPMSDKFSNIYNTVKKEVLADIETLSGTSRLNITNIFTRLLRLQQVTGGFIIDSNKNFKPLKEQPKLNAIVEEIDSIIDAEESCIIWCKFRPSMSLIAKELKKKRIKFYHMSGDDSPREKETKWRGFQNSKDINVFIGQIRAGGIGIELFKIDGDSNKSQSSLFYENEWPLEIREQAEGRPDRIGQKSLCRYVDFVIENTIDERILESIRQGQEVADSILKQGVRGFLK